MIILDVCYTAVEIVNAIIVKSNGIYIQLQHVDKNNAHDLIIVNGCGDTCIWVCITLLWDTVGDSRGVTTTVEQHSPSLLQHMFKPVMDPAGKTPRDFSWSFLNGVSATDVFVRMSSTVIRYKLQVTSV